MQSSIIVPQRQSKRVTWSNSTTSGEIEIGGVTKRLQLELPATFLGTTLTYLCKTDAGDFVPLQKDGSAVTDTVAGSTASRNVLSADLAGVDVIKIVSDVTEGTDPACDAVLHGES